jgi:L-alanine-DL-glutamate epimerase-like enolase superfamily enzyme
VGIRIAIDANQRWNVDGAVEWTNALAEFDPYWIEEPTSPDDILGHATVRRGVAPVKVATGEHVQNRIVFKQLLQAGAIDVLQIDAARVGGVNENLAILLLAAKFGVPPWVGRLLDAAEDPEGRGCARPADAGHHRRHGRVAGLIACHVPVLGPVGCC